MRCKRAAVEYWLERSATPGGFCVIDWIDRIYSNKHLELLVSPKYNASGGLFEKYGTKPIQFGQCSSLAH